VGCVPLENSDSEVGQWLLANSGSGFDGEISVGTTTADSKWFMGVGSNGPVLYGRAGCVVYFVGSLEYSE
jgi:hypothetical protein